ncbi:glycine-rich RNA-binding protein 4, mitochondrial isoform X2 [Exaiptasia diaphana]|uniref:RRM domain-containing protein n=1 Tax=Exaiptasia diaphana TaxID=2652724 RepID=A0A913X5X0_EXADI|nr:glycine-rich RNA-binding protein 4, mitochondrial isoform X2 [Exaiptasia diaphana]
MDHYTEIRIHPTRVFIGGLARGTSELELENFFAEYGAITDVRIVCDKHTGVSKGFGFVTYETPESRDSVLIKDKIDYNGRQLRLRLAIRRKGHGQFVTEVTDYGSPNGVLPTIQLWHLWLLWLHGSTSRRRSNLFLHVDCVYKYTL